MARSIIVRKNILASAVCLMFIQLFFSCTPLGFFHKTVLQKRNDDIPSEFGRRCELAGELVQDDRMAWSTSDTIAAEKPMLLDTTDQTWFVYLLNNRRFAYYGRFSPEDDQYYPKYAFIKNLHGMVERLPPSVDDTTLSYARAVHTGSVFFTALIDSLQQDISFNHYIRRLPDNSYTVWFFPAGYDDYFAHGLDIKLSIDSTGTSVTDYKISGRFPRYFEITQKDRTIELDNSYDSIPSLGNLFFMYMNREHFRKIVIINTASTSTMVYKPDKNEWVWVHTPKQQTIP